MNAVPGQPALTIPDNFDLYLFEHPLAAASDLLRITDGDETLWWPRDRTWVYARPVDSDELCVACDDSLAEALLGCRLNGVRQD